MGQGCHAVCGLLPESLEVNADFEPDVFGLATPVAPSATELSLKRYVFSSFLIKRSRGEAAAPPLGYTESSGQLRHLGTNIVLRCPPLQVGPILADCIALYHYTHESAFRLITTSKNLQNLRASYGERAHYGDGVYASQNAPHDFETKDAVLLNNYTNKEDPEDQEQQIKQWREKGAADFCVPIIVPRDLAFNTRTQKTKEMPKPGYTIRGHPMRPNRDLWVICLKEGKSGQARDIYEHVEAQYKRLRDNDWKVRLHAVEVLAGELSSRCDRRTTDLMIDRLVDEHHEVRIAAIWALATAKSLGPLEAYGLIRHTGLDPEYHSEVIEAKADALHYLQEAP